MQISSFSSAKSFFKTGRFRSRKQNPTSQELTTTTTNPSLNPTAYTTRNTSIDTTRTKSPSLWMSMSRRNAAASADTPKNQSQNRSNPHDPDTVTQRPRRSDDTMREPVGIAAAYQAQQVDSSTLLDDTDYQALGFFPSASQREQSPSAANTAHYASHAASSGQPPQLENMFELEVPAHVSRGGRPDLQVTIPLHTQPTKSPHLLSAMQLGAAPPSAISTASSSLPTGRYAKSATTATPRSVVSPFTAIEMSGDDRFPAASADGTSAYKQYNNSSRDQRQQTMQQSRRTSVISELGTRTPSGVNAAPGRADANNPYYTSQSHGLASSSRKNSSTNLRQQPYMHRKGSTLSVASQANVHKPLPPEPPSGMTRQAVPASPSKHIAYSTTSHSTQHRPQTSKSTSTAKTAGRPSPLKSEPPSPDNHRPFAKVRRGSESSLARSTTLRSKYTPKDLDSMDEAFQRRTATTPTHRTPTSLSRSRASPEQSQLSLHPIAESSYPPNPKPLAIVDEPLQISRGPMRMEPTRRPPQPPPPPPPQPTRVQTSECDGDIGSRSRPTISRTQSNKSMRTAKTIKTGAGPNTNASPPEPTPTKRKMNPPANNVSKADRILGLSATSAMARQMYDARSPDYDMSTSVAALLDDSEDEDFYEIRGKKDAQFEEIHSRLKLLSAREDPAVTFDAWHEEDAYQQAPWEEKAYKRMEGKTETKPTIEEKLHLTGTLEGNPIVPTFIAELPGEKTPSPVELQGCEISTPAPDIMAEGPSDIRIELGVPSPEMQAAIPVPSNNLLIEPADRRGRTTATAPLSVASGTSKSFRSNRSMRVQSLASIAASDIPDYYANAATSYSHSKRPSLAGSEYEEAPLTAQAAEQVLLHILQSLDNLEDLFSAARVSKGFYRTFKRNELYLLKHAIWKMSPAAWELREMSIPFSELPATAKDYTPELYFTYYVQDLLAMVELKAMILESCKSFLRPETISGLTGETARSPFIDDAFWRIWTFCRIFGCGTKREEDIVGQMDWLRGGVIARQSPDRRTLALTDELARNSVLFNPPAGFARGNGQHGLTAEELYDMIEVWTCLGVLVQGYHGRRQEARDYGIYDRCNIEVGDVVSENAMLEEWTNYLLTLAPSTVLDVTSPAAPSRTQFAQARSQGYTKWSPPKQGMSRSTFLKEAVSRVYKESEARQRPIQSASTPAFSTLVTMHPSVGADAAVAAKERIQRHQVEIRKRKEDPEYKNLPVSDERPLSNYSDVLDRLEAISVATDAPPMPKLPGLAARLSRAKSEGSSILAENLVLRPTSPVPSAHSSTASVQASIPSQENFPSADQPTQGASSNKFIKKMRHPWARNRDTSEPPQPSSKPGVNRFASIRNNKLVEKTMANQEKSREGGSSVESLSRAPAVVSSDDKFAILSSGTSSKDSSFASSPTRDPIEAALDTLTAMGYDKEVARKALIQSSAVGGINFDAALARLRKDKERKKRLERLQTMG